MHKNIYAHLREQIGVLAPEGRDLHELRNQTLVALDEDRLDDVQSLLRRLESSISDPNPFPRRDLTAAGIQAALGWVAMLKSEYQSAAGHFHEAARVLPARERGKRRDYRPAEADTHLRQGQAQGDEQALRHAVTLLGALLRQTPRERMPVQWKKLQNDLAMPAWCWANAKTVLRRSRKPFPLFRPLRMENFWRAIPSTGR